jgi:hypothetical protein
MTEEVRAEGLPASCTPVALWDVSSRALTPSANSCVGLVEAVGGSSDIATLVQDPKPNTSVNGRHRLEEGANVT